MIPLLAPIFRGELAPLGQRLQLADTVPADAVRVDTLHGPALASVLRRHARFRQHHGPDLRAVASAWSLDYLGVLLPPVVAAASVLQHVFPVAADAIWVRLDEDGFARSFHLRALGQACPGTPTAQRYAPLLRQHLAPLFAALSCQTRLAPKILWGNVARHLEPILDQALALTGGQPPLAQDRALLLRGPAWAHGAVPEPNPMFGERREVLEGGIPLRLHRQCCLYYLLPGESHCGACPLAPRG